MDSALLRMQQIHSHWPSFCKTISNIIIPVTHGIVPSNIETFVWITHLSVRATCPVQRFFFIPLIILGDLWPT